MDGPETPGFEFTENKESDKTFNTLIKLQDLVQKESAMKELCKK